MGIIPTKDAKSFRLIHHLSFPAGNSLNDVIDPNICSVSYSLFDDAISIVHAVGCSALLSKADIKLTFCYQFTRLLLIRWDFILMANFISIVVSRWDVLFLVAILKPSPHF